MVLGRWATEPLNEMSCRIGLTAILFQAAGRIISDVGVLFRSAICIETIAIDGIESPVESTAVAANGLQTLARRGNIESLHRFTASWRHYSPLWPSSISSVFSGAKLADGITNLQYCITFAEDYLHKMTRESKSSDKRILKEPLESG